MSDTQPQTTNNNPSSVTTTQNFAPISGSKRIDAMDILRGLALVGILLMNIEWFNRAISSLGTQDTSLTGLDHAVGWFIRCFVEGKFYKLFALLFGMGFAVMLLRAKELDRPFGAWFSRRMITLYVIGLLHMVFLWGGDILHDYGFSGLVLLGWIFLLRKPKFQKYDNLASFFKLSVVWLCVPVFLATVAGMIFGMANDTNSLNDQWKEQQLVAEKVASITKEKERLALDSLLDDLSKNESLPITESSTAEPIDENTFVSEELDNITEPNKTLDAEQAEQQTEQQTEQIEEAISEEDQIQLQAETIVEQRDEMANNAQEEVNAFTQGSYWQATAYRAKFAGMMMMFSPVFALSMLLPIFILGYWLVASGIMRNYQQHQKAFKITAWVGFGLGSVIETAGLLVAQHPASEQVMLLLVVGQTLFFIGQLVMTVGYFGLIMALLCSTKWHNRLAKFSAMGRMALTNYIMHSVILTSIFYGYAGGYFGEISRAPQMLIVLAIVVFQLVFSRWWLNRFAFGPLEWVWRCISYKQLQPMKLPS